MPLTIARHLLGALSAWIVGWALKHGVVLDPEALFATMIGVYALVEKLLKPAAAKMGEIQS